MAPLLMVEVIRHIGTRGKTVLGSAAGIAAGTGTRASLVAVGVGEAWNGRGGRN